MIQDTSSKNRGWNIWTGPIGSGKQRITVTYIRAEPDELSKNKETISIPPISADEREVLTPSDDVISQLERLSELKEKGILTEEEFQIQKKKILGM